MSPTGFEAAAVLSGAFLSGELAFFSGDKIIPFLGLYLSARLHDIPLSRGSAVDAGRRL